MNCMTDTWSVFGRYQGQLVERAYRYDADTGRVIRRTHDRSDNIMRYDGAPCPEDLEWNGSEGAVDFSGLDWEPCENQFDD